MSKRNWYWQTPKACMWFSTHSTMGFWALRALPTSLDLRHGWRTPPHLGCLTTEGKKGELDTLALLVATTFSLPPPLEWAFCSPILPYDHVAKPSTFTRSYMKSNYHPGTSTRVFCLWELVVYVCYLYMLMSCLEFKFCYRPRRKMSCHHYFCLTVEGCPASLFLS